jgi:hypothetical protein
MGILGKDNKSRCVIHIVFKRTRRMAVFYCLKGFKNGR